MEKYEETENINAHSETTYTHTYCEILSLSLSLAGFKLMSLRRSLAEQQKSIRPPTDRTEMLHHALTDTLIHTHSGGGEKVS